MDPMLRMVSLIFIAILLILGLYYLYRWINGSADVKDIVLYSSVDSGIPGKSDAATIYNDARVPTLYSGGEYSVSTWIYVTNWGINNALNKTFLKLSGGGSQYSTLVMYLGQRVNKLGIRVSTDSSATGTPFLLDSTQMSLINNGASPYSDVSSDFKKCDIDSVDLQKWVNITAVLSGRTLDVYIDGKLSRSCVLNGVYKVDSTSATTLSLGGANGFGGLIGLTRAANFAYSPDLVYKYYQNGPFSTFSFFDLSKYSLDITRDGKSIFSTGN